MNNIFFIFLFAMITINSYGNMCTDHNTSKSKQNHSKQTINHTETNLQVQKKIMLPYTMKLVGKVSGIPFKIEGYRELSQNKEGIWTLVMHAGMKLLSTTETSQFTLGENNSIQSIKYEYRKGGLFGGHINRTLDFKDEKQIVVYENNEKKQFLLNKNAIKNHIMDALGYQLQLRYDLAMDKKTITYHLINHKGIYQRTFHVIQQEIMETPWGKLKTVKVEIKRPNNKKRQTYIWFIPSLNYRFFKFWQREGKTTYEVKAISYKTETNQN